MSIDEKGEMDMCKGMEEYTLKVKIEEAIQIYKDFGKSDEEIIDAMVERYLVSADYVKSLMKPKPA